MELDVWIDDIYKYITTVEMETPTCLHGLETALLTEQQQYSNNNNNNNNNRRAKLARTTGE